MKNWVMMDSEFGGRPCIAVFCCTVVRFLVGLLVCSCLLQCRVVSALWFMRNVLELRVFESGLVVVCFRGKVARV